MLSNAGTRCATPLRDAGASQVKRLLAQMEVQKQKSLKIAEFVAELQVCLCGRRTSRNHMHARRCVCMYRHTHAYMYQEKCGDTLDPSLLAAAKKGGVDAVSRRLERVLPHNERGETLLVQASRAGKLEAVGMFLSCGANAESGDLFGNTALMCASACGHAPVVQRLLKAKANVDARNGSGCTALWKASQNGHAAVVQVLVLGGADPNTVGQGMSALYVAAQSGHPAVSRLLTDARSCVIVIIIQTEGLILLSSGSSFKRHSTVGLIIIIIMPRLLSFLCPGAERTLMHRGAMA
jgi:hypothetical protein